MPNAPVNFLHPDNQRRQQPDDVALGAVDQKPPFPAGRHHRRAFLVQLQAPHEAQAPHFLNYRET